MTVSSGHVDQDWREKKEYILRSLDSLTVKVDQLQICMQKGFEELRTDVAVMKSSSSVTPSELEDMVERMLRDKKNPSQTLTKDEIRHIAEESVKAKNGRTPEVEETEAKGMNWEPWRYVMLGAILLGGNRLLEYILG